MNSWMPEYLQERLRPTNDRAPSPDGRFVLYWMHHALRGHENPALDVAIVTSKRLGLPIFVYQELSERYPYASDRHHAFCLQGARDVHAELAGRGIGSAFHLERRGHRGPHLKTLAAQAAVVICEDMPTEPFTSWIASLSAAVAAPVWLVDTACVVPMRLVGKAYDRAFAYRDATLPLLEKRLTQPWIEQSDPPERFIPPDLPFTPLDLGPEEWHTVIADCDIDHAVGPIPHTLGGSSAGYARWKAFKGKKLGRYADDRNDALRDGVSRMSAYLHYGMVSPLKIAREAAAVRGPGAEKYLDELLVWREIAYCFCFYRPKHEMIAAIPTWAATTLRDHEADMRSAILDWETLSRGSTGDPLWDAAQRSLVMQGELHNNLRMTWGKAFLGWTPDAATALRLMIDLNHRYALDGRDPASYGGLLWCLGQFDRPHTPPRGVFGTVRTRPTQEHAARLDPAQYLEKATRPWRMPVPKVAVVGAGLAGLICARTLKDHGFDVTVFEKSEGLGGRAATRRVIPGLSFDHGAQYFTARNPHFVRHVESWKDLGIVAEWAGQIVSITGADIRPKTDQPARYVGVPGMSAIARHLAADVPTRVATKICQLEGFGDGWHLTDAAGQAFHPFDHVVLSVPAPQALGLLGGRPLADAIKDVPMTPCWSVLLAFERPVDVAWDGAFVHGSPLAWVARDSSKPGRNKGVECWVLHASPEWSAAHLETSKREVIEFLLDEFSTITSAPLPMSIHQDAHRWLFSATPLSLDLLALFDPDSGVVVCGDWLAGGRVEGAFCSGIAAAGCLLRHTGIPPGKERSTAQLVKQ